jgi:DHA1 family bicyclomycin/chloramphenicol resistance-like MFS transporter
MANNMLLPALPDIQQHFAATLPAAQTTISFYLISFAVGILFVGPLSDRFGRRPVIAGGLAIFILGSVLAALAPTLYWLVFGRIIQALGAAAGLTVSRAIAGDRYQGASLAQALAVVTMTMMLGTTLSPALGGYLVKWFDWHTGFWLMAALAVIVLACVLKLLPETRRPSSKAETARELALEARAVLANPRFVGYALQIGLIYAIFLTFIAVTPYVMQQAFGRGGTDFGFYYILLSAGYFVGNLFVATAGRGIAPEKLMFLGLGLQMVGAAIGLALALTGVWSPMALFLPQLPLAFGQGLALPHLTARAVRLAPEYPGVASSVIGFSQQAFAGICVQAMGLIATNSPLPINIFCMAAAVVAMGSLLLLTPRHARQQAGI